MKDYTVVSQQFAAGVGVNLIFCIALLISVGVCQVSAETLLSEPKQLKVSEPRKLKVSEPKQLKVSEPKQLQVSEPEKLIVSEPKTLGVRKPRSGLVPRETGSGATVLSGSRENASYNRCAKLKGFDAQHQCALDALGTTEEELE
jgi:hypothetical protein